jgi:hypothetical protein
MLSTYSVKKSVYPGIVTGPLSMEEKVQYKGYVVGLGEEPNGRRPVDISPPSLEVVRVYDSQGLRRIFDIYPIGIGSFVSIVLFKRACAETGSRHLFSVQVFDSSRKLLAQLQNEADGHTVGFITKLGKKYEVSTRSAELLKETEPEQQDSQPQQTRRSTKKTTTVAVPLNSGDVVSTSTPKLHIQTGLWRVNVALPNRNYCAGFRTKEEADTFVKHFHRMWQPSPRKDAA